jgi:anti-sigma B factor antagonist
MEVAVKLSSRLVDGTPVIDADGELDYVAIPEFKDEVSGFIEQGHTNIVIDMSHICFMDSGGISSIIYTMKRLASLNGGVTLAGCNKKIIRKLEIGGLTRISSALRFAPDVEQAVRELRKAL